jgi:hypothetical protein
VHKRVELKAAAGIFQQKPPGDTMPLTGNPRLGLQSALHTTLGMSVQITQALSLDVNGFFNYLWDLPRSSDAFDISLDGTVTPRIVETGGIGRIYGGEIFLRHQPYKNFYGWVAYTLSRSERNDNTNGSTWHLYDYDQTHILTVVASYILPYGFQVGARFRLVSGNPYTPVVRAVYDADTQSYAPVNGPTNSARLPVFHQLDLRVDRTWVFDTFSFMIYVDVQNVYNRVNANSFAQFGLPPVNYSYDFRQQTYFPGLPILPVLGLQADW